MRIAFLLLSLSFFNAFTQAQTTAIPDVNFEQELINLGYDTGTPDGMVLTANIDTISTLVVANKNISDLTGIESFSSLATLHCNNNQLTALNVTQNTALIYLNVSENQLTSLDVTLNTALTNLHCFSNQIATLDVTQNTALTHLVCWFNQLTSLNVTQNSSLTRLDCMFNQLTSLNVNQNTALTFLQCNDNNISMLNISQNTAITELYSNDNKLTCLNVKNGNNTNLSNLRTGNNPNLTCIEVDDVNWSTSNWIGSNYSFDNWVSFNQNCPNSCTVGIIENSLTELSIYPNPTEKSIRIDLGETLTSPRITLTNSLGQVVLTKHFGSTDYISLDIDAPKGIYFLQLQTENGEVITKKIVKE